jgi:hypothetical protein
MKPDRVHLHGLSENFNDMARPVRATLFGEMVRRAAPIIKAYHSDLYHDAEWLTENLNGQTTFDWLVRRSGTHLGVGPQNDGNGALIWAYRMGTEPGDQLWRITVRCDRGMWVADFVRLPLRSDAPAEMVSR